MRITLTRDGWARVRRGISRSVMVCVDPEGNHGTRIAIEMNPSQARELLNGLTNTLARIDQGE